MRLMRGRAASQDLASEIFGRAKVLDAVKTANCSGSVMAPRRRVGGLGGTTEASVLRAEGRVTTVGASRAAALRPGCAAGGAGEGAGMAGRLEGKESPEAEELADVGTAGWVVEDEEAQGGTVGALCDPPCSA